MEKYTVREIEDTYLKQVDTLRREIKRAQFKMLCWPATLHEWSWWKVAWIRWTHSWFYSAREWDRFEKEQTSALAHMLQVADQVPYEIEQWTTVDVRTELFDTLNMNLYPTWAYHKHMNWLLWRAVSNSLHGRKKRFWNTHNDSQFKSIDWSWTVLPLIVENTWWDYHCVVHPARWKTRFDMAAIKKFYTEDIHWNPTHDSRLHAYKRRIDDYMEQWWSYVIPTSFLKSIS